MVLCFYVCLVLFGSCMCVGVYVDSGVLMFVACGCTMYCYSGCVSVCMGVYVYVNGSALL